MKALVVKLMLVCVLGLGGCLGGAPSAAPEPRSVRIFVHAIDDETHEPLSGVKVYFTFGYPRVERPIPFKSEAIKLGVITTDDLGNGVIDLEVTTAVKLRDAVFPGYLWVREGARYIEASGRWLGGRGSTSYSAKDGSMSLNSLGLAAETPFVFLMRKGEKGWIWDNWKRFGPAEEFHQ